jgi:uncharacterized protein YrrD
MLRSAKELESFSIGATDGPVGNVRDFYFDDQAWIVRYLVVETGSWLSNRPVLIAPTSLGTLDLGSEVIPANLTRTQVHDSPAIDTHKPISRQEEEKLLTYYGHATYWDGSALIENDIASGLLMTARPSALPPLEAIDVPRSPPGDSHLRSCNAVTGYHVHATDGDIGHVDGMLIDPRDWHVRFFIVNTSNWWLGYRVLISTQLVTDVAWGDSTVTVQLSRGAIRNSHVYDESLTDVDSDFGIYDGH